MALFSNGSSSNKYISIELETRVDSQSTADNTTTLSWWLRVRKSGASTSATWGNCSYSANIGGHTYSGSGHVRVSPGSATELLSGAVTVGHNSDGALTLSVSGSISGYIVGSVSGSQALATIPRASSLAYASPSGQCTIGSPITVCANAHSDRFTHSLTIQYGNYSTTILSYAAGNTNYSWTPAMEMCAQTPNATQGVGTLTLYTWVGRGESLVGTESYPITLYVPNSVVPKITAVKLSPTSENEAIRDWGIYVKGYSKVTAKTTAGGAYGSTIKKIVYTISNIGSENGNLNYQSPILNSSGTITVKAQAVDSRGRYSDVYEQTITVYDYTAPTLSGVSVFRCNADGSPDKAGTYLSAQATANYASVAGKNEVDLNLQYRTAGGIHPGEYIETVQLTSGAAKIFGKGILASTSYRWLITATDSVGKSAIAQAVIPTDDVAFHLKEGGKGGAFGKYAEEDDLLDVQWNIKCRKNIYIESATGPIVDNIKYEFETVKQIEAEHFESTSASITALKAKNAEITNLVATKVDVSDLTVATARVDALETSKADVTDLTAVRGQVDELTGRTATIEQAYISSAEVGDLLAGKADVDDLHAATARVDALETGKADVSALSAAQAQIKQLDADKLSTTEAAIRYANIDFSNIGKAAIEQFYATSGIIKDLVIGDTTITGELVGVTIRGDLIEGGTVVADKLVVKGQDGLYYKLNTDGVTTEAQQTDYNSLSGQIIRAKSVTASKIAVDDLVAFGATIGGFHITDSALYSGAKSSATNTTRGVYLDSTGQLCVGDSKSYLRYYKGSDGQYRLEIAAAAMTLSTGQSVETALEETNSAVQAASSKAQAAQNAADAAQNQLNRRGLREYIINLLDTSTYDTDTYYPVVGSSIPYNGYHTFEVNNQLQSDTAPSWSTHTNKGFTCNLSARMIAFGWGTVVQKFGWIDNAGFAWCDRMPAYIQQMGHASYPVFYLRGGGKYYVYTDYACTWSIKKDTFTASGESVAPTKTPANWQWLVNNWDVVTRVAKAETSITQNASAIALKASQASVDALSKDVTAKLDVCITTDPADRSKVISAINASADAIALNSNRLTINSDNFTLAADGTVTATAGEIAGFKLKTGKINGLTQHSLLGGYESNGKQYGLRLIPQSGTDEWNSAISFINGSASVNLEAVRRETGEGFQELCITGAPVHAANGLRIGNDTVADFVVAQGTSGSWYYRKWASGWAECWSGFSPSSSVGNDKYIGISFPFTFKSVHTILTTSSSTRSAGQYGTIMTSARSVGNSGCQLCQVGTAYSNVYVQVYVGGTIG